MKRIVSLLVALMLLVACAQAAEYAPAITDEPATLTCMRYIRDIDNIDMSNLWYNEHVEELTGVHIDYQVVSQSDFKTQLNLMFSSQEYPDFIIDCGNNIDIEMYGVDQGVFMPLNDLIDEYMPNYKALMAENDLTYKSTMASDGNIYAIGYIADANAPASNNFFFVNQNWLDEQGLDMPGCPDEILEVMRAFKEAYPDNYIWEERFDDCLWYISQLWGITENNKWFSITNDGEVVFNATRDGYREMVEFLATCYEEGILDPDFITQDSNTKISKLNDKDIGFSILWRTRSMGWDGLIGKMAFVMPVANDGYEVSIKYNIPLANRQVLIPKTCSNPELVAKWVDYQLVPQLVFEGFYGPEGNIWSWVDGKCTLGPSGDQDCVKWAYGVNTICYMPGGVYNTYFRQPDYRIERADYCEMASPYYEKYSIQYVTGLANPTADEATEIAKLYATIDSTVRSSLASMIMEGVTDEKWDAFQAELVNAGIERYIEIYQGVFDGYVG